jgi:hypothetical protein
MKFPLEVISNINAKNEKMTIPRIMPFIKNDEMPLCIFLDFIISKF